MRGDAKELQAPFHTNFEIKLLSLVETPGQANFLESAYTIANHLVNPTRSYNYVDGNPYKHRQWWQKNRKM